MHVFFLAPRVLAAKLIALFTSRPPRRDAPEEPTFWILHAR